MLIILLGSYVCPIIIHAATVAIPAISEDMSLTAQAGSWISFLPAMGSVLMVLPAGKLADIHGRRKAFCLGLMMAAAACVIAGFASHQITLFIARLMMGISLAFVWASALALVSSIPRPENKVKIIGLLGAVSYLGIVSGPVIGGIIIDHIHWRWVFFIPGFLLLPIAILGLTRLNWERYGDRNMRLNAIDVILYIVSMGFIGCSLMSQSLLTTASVMALGLILFAFFCWTQTRRSDPLLQIRLFTESPLFSAIATIHLLTYLCIFAFPLTLTMYLSYLKDLDGSAIGAIIMVQALATSLFSFGNNWLSQFFKLKIFLGLGFLLIFVGVVLLSLVGSDTPKWHILAILFAVGAGVGIFDTQVVHIAMTSVKDSLLGSASATINGMRTLGGFLSLGIASILMDIHVGGTVTVENLPELAKALNEYYWIAAAGLSLAILLIVVKVFPEISKQNGAT